MRCGDIRHAPCDILHATCGHVVHRVFDAFVLVSLRQNDCFCVFLLLPLVDCFACLMCLWVFDAFLLVLLRQNDCFCVFMRLLLVVCSVCLVVFMGV